MDWRTALLFQQAKVLAVLLFQHLTVLGINAV
jgi:hypothetical protein